MLLAVGDGAAEGLEGGRPEALLGPIGVERRHYVVGDKGHACAGRHASLPQSTAHVIEHAGSDMDVVGAAGEFHGKGPGAGQGQHPPGHRGNGETRGVDVPGKISVGGAAEGEEPVDLGGGIFDVKQRAGAAVTEARENRVGRGVEADDGMRPGDGGTAIVGVHERAASRGDDLTGVVKELGDEARLHLPEPRLAFFDEDTADGLTRAGLDLRVHVDEGALEVFRDPPTHGALSGAHKASEDEVSSAPPCSIHRSSL